MVPRCERPACSTPALVPTGMVLLLLSGIRIWLLLTVMKGFAVGWDLWLLLTFLPCKRLQNFSSRPWELSQGTHEWEWQLAGVFQAGISDMVLQWWAHSAWSHSSWWAVMAVPPFPVSLEHLGIVTPLPESPAGLVGDTTSVLSVPQLLQTSPSWPLNWDLGWGSSESVPGCRGCFRQIQSTGSAAGLCLGSGLGAQGDLLLLSDFWGEEKPSLHQAYLMSKGFRSMKGNSSRSGGIPQGQRQRLTSLHTDLCTSKRAFPLVLRLDRFFLSDVPGTSSVWAWPLCRTEFCSEGMKRSLLLIFTSPLHLMGDL